ncbi:MAG: polysaccharide biosynthesis tyrosine autokinase [Tannerellaceae bacterium]|jgi:capsular exopolysaccharide synthesis family protein|nr:polysaccharide biosynthesis tyrosine autokinase [Tannerellaceae bacterium]
MTTPQNTKPGQTEDFMRVQDLLYLCLSKWRWFAMSVPAVLSIAVAYLLVTPPVYLRSASILIKDDSKGKSLSTEMESFADFGLFQSNTNVNNELIALQSPALMLEVIRRLHLEMNYRFEGRFYREVAYGHTLPVSVSLADFPDNESAAFTVHIREDGTVDLSNFQRNGEDMDAALSGKLTDTIHSPLGPVSIAPTPHYAEGVSSVIYVSRSTLYGAVENYAARLSVSLSSEKASIIDLSFKDVSVQRAEDVLNTLISVYNENWVKDKNQIAAGTSLFINERLGMIESELGNVDDDISSYKSEHLLPDVQAASSMYMEQNSATSARIRDLNNQLYMTRYIRSYLTNEANRLQLLPVNSGIEGSNIESQIAEYNTRLLQRNSLVANSSTQNPLVIDLDRALESMRRAIITSIDNRSAALNTQVSTLRRSERQTTSRIAESPTQAKYLLSVERQQKVKEALYLFLLQKREENELSQAFTAYNTRVITPPSGKMEPVAPVKRNILLVAFMLGLLIPVAVIFVRENMNSTVRGRKDLEGLSVPFIGEIPFSAATRKSGLFRKKRTETEAAVVVKEGNRNAVNEAFRVVRTNLEFMTSGEGSSSHVIAITSFNPGSGKTFVTVNLAAGLAIKGKNVLVIDGDLRHASASAYAGSPKNGLSDYLSGCAENTDSMTVSVAAHGNLHILPVGTVPPNPAELLEDGRFGELINRQRERYDYILIDCPPVEIVADTQIIGKLADRTLFVVRAGLMERGMLAELENLYNGKKFKNMSVILNGTAGAGGYYRYGYHYGYGYGYHYDADK